MKIITKLVISTFFIFQFSSAMADTINNDKRLAGHPATPVEKLWELSDNPDWEVRETLGRIRKAPEKLLSKLARDSNMHVRIAVATN